MDDGNSHCPWYLFCIALTLLLLLAGCGKPARSVTLALLGDINLGRGVMSEADSFTYLAGEMEKADLVLANLESPLAAEPPVGASEYNICAPAERAAFLSDWGFDLVSIANNHSLDCGPAGANGMTTALEEAGITPIGPSLEAIHRTVNGTKLAFLAFDDISAPVDLEGATGVIRSARQAGAVVIVSVHWGMEYQEGASERQEQLADRFAEAGAALIWGHHPHVLQPVKWIETSRGRTLVLYSLGNALFDQEGLADTRESALLMVEVDGQGAKSVRAVPFIIDISDSRVKGLDLDTARKILVRLKIE